MRAVIVVLLASLAALGQNVQKRYRWQHVFKDQNNAVDPCDYQVTFCFHGPYRDGSDEIDAWGNRWVSESGTPKLPGQEVTEVRCLKARQLCILAHSILVASLPRTEIELYRVKNWNTSEVQASSEDHNAFGTATLLINLEEGSVFLTLVPNQLGSRAGDKTTMYKLKQ